MITLVIKWVTFTLSFILTCQHCYRRSKMFFAKFIPTASGRGSTRR